MGKDRIPDADYNDHCPECGGTEFSWINYDPDTKEGCSNRKKYCKEWDPAAALDKIIAVQVDPEFEPKVGETVAPKGSWPF
jgi:hypothetical protein